MNKIIGGDYYHKHNIEIPLIQLKYYGNNGKNKCVNDPIYNPTVYVAPDEIFAFIDDRVLPNVIAGRYVISTYGRIFDRVLNKFLNPVGNGRCNADGTPNPYYKVKLSYYKSWDVLELKDVYIHRAVLLTFNYLYYADSPTISGLEVNHIDGNHANNRLDNLEWVNRSQNMNHAYYNGLMNNAVLVDPNLSTSDPNQPIRMVCSLMQDGYTNSEIADMLNIQAYEVSRVRRGEAYREYSREYKIPKRSINKEKYETAVRICELLASGDYSITKIAEIMNVPRHIVADIKNRRNYTHISCNYTW